MLRYDHLSLEERIRARDRDIERSVARRLRAARPTKALSKPIEDQIDDIINRRQTGPMRAWRTPSINEALSVPAILRAVSLISSTTGMLSVQGYRQGVVMDGFDGRPAPPLLVTRPDPDHTPYYFFARTSGQIAKAGEFVWWIASRDTDGLASALVNVPLAELQVHDNQRDRRRARYVWGNITSTRYSPANPEGQFVHEMYPVSEPFQLRGQGPLQLAKAATSVSVESQTWAANFFAKGGHPREIVAWNGYLDPTLKDDMGLPDPEKGVNEADRLRAQYMARDNNVPIVIDDHIKDIKPASVDVGGAQMLEARIHQRGDVANMFSLPGKFVEYVQSGTSLTYQSLESAFEDLVKTCLQPLYLEPIEQALSDLLPRTTSARFNVKGFLRADIKTRAEAYNLMVPLGIISAQEARQEEGYAPGDVEFAPIAFAPPAAIPARIPNIGTSLSMRDVRCESCGRLIVRAAGPVEGFCRHCKAEVRVA